MSPVTVRVFRLLASNIAPELEPRLRCHHGSAPSSTWLSRSLVRHFRALEGRQGDLSGPGQLFQFLVHIQLARPEALLRLECLLPRAPRRLLHRRHALSRHRHPPVQPDRQVRCHEHGLRRLSLCSPQSSGGPQRQVSSPCSYRTRRPAQHGPSRPSLDLCGAGARVENDCQRFHGDSPLRGRPALPRDGSWPGLLASSR
mmetsp:Transcript_1052/g.2301  ORF Transcript_1052/g.2301 Transcript_1052/m.2301 type:complete len:200 (-) Transcript_1052:71-670(-)